MTAHILAAALALLGSGPDLHPLAQACLPSVQLDGEASLVGPLGEALTSRGLRVGGGATPCGRLLVAARPEPPGIALSITTESGHEVRRHAARIEGAATAIESFARPDLVAPLLARRAPSVLTPRARPVERRVPSRDSNPSPPGPTRTVAVSASAVVGYGDDGSSWTGGQVQGCVSIWRLCVGGRLQVATDQAWSGHSAALDTRRLAVDLSAMVDMPLAVGPVRLVPGLGLGLRAARLSRALPEGTIVDDSSGFGARVQLSTELQIARDWFLQLQTAVDLQPLARRTVYEGLVDGGPEDTPMASGPAVLGWLSLGLVAEGL